MVFFFQLFAKHKIGFIQNNGVPIYTNSLFEIEFLAVEFPITTRNLKPQNELINDLFCIFQVLFRTGAKHANERNKVDIRPILCLRVVLFILPRKRIFFYKRIHERTFSQIFTPTLINPCDQIFSTLTLMYFVCIGINGPFFVQNNNSFFLYFISFCFLLLF